MNPIVMRYGAYLMLVVAVLMGLKWVEYHIEQRGYKAGQAEVQGRWTKETAERTRHALRLSESNRDEEARREAKKQEAVDEAQKQTTLALVEAAASDRAADGVRAQLAAFIADRRSREATANPKALTPGSSAGDAYGVLTDMYFSTDRRAGVLAKALDAAYTAGKTCEREHDALN